MAERLEGLGHEVVEADLDYGLVAPALVPRGMAGVRRLGPGPRHRLRALEPRTRVHARLGGLLSGPPLRAARAAEPSLRRRLGRTFERHDLVLTPVTATPPPRIGQYDGRGYWATGGSASDSCPFAFPWNVTGWPGISVPNGLTATGLPIGAQLVAPAADEGTLLSLAAQLEAERRWHAAAAGPGLLGPDSGGAATAIVYAQMRGFARLGRRPAAAALAGPRLRLPRLE